METPTNPQNPSSQNNEGNTNNEPKPKVRNKKNSRRFLLIFIILLVVGGGFGIYEYLYAQGHASTDDAQIEANIGPIIARASGYVKQLRVDDNDKVKKGDTLLVLDDSEMSIKVEEANAALQNAEANLSAAKSGKITAEANVSTSAANLSAAEASLQAAQVKKWQATQNFQRYSNLIANNSVTQQEFDNVKADKESAEKEYDRAQKQRDAAAMQLKASKAQSGAADDQISVAQSVVKQRQADLDYAKLMHSYCWITAPDDGTVTKRSIELGQFVQAGTATFALVRDNRKWIDANFKETDLEAMQTGQKVDIEVDAFPDSVFHGRVTSLSPATGAKFALLPPDNATGNFVKIVQRVPVRIEFEESKAHMDMLKAGMNVVVTVNLNK